VDMGPPLKMSVSTDNEDSSFEPTASSGMKNFCLRPKSVGN
jgi:hypothetical protein